MTRRKTADKLCYSCGRKMKKATGNYHYKECGLDNVTLAGITIYKCKCGEDMPVIPNVDGLHQIIGIDTVKSTATLSGKQIRFLRKEMGYSATWFAHILGASKVTVSRWESGAEHIGRAYDRVIRIFYLRNLEEKSKKVVALNIESIMESISKDRKKEKPIKIQMGQIDSLKPCYL